MMKKIFCMVVMLVVTLTMSATDYYLSTTGSDANSGTTRTQAFATLGKAQSVVKAGDNVYILPGTYAITESQISKTDSPYKIVFNLSQNGKAEKPISFIGLTENGQRPVFDLSQVNPTGYRVTAFYVTGSYLVFRNFEVTGMMVNLTDHTQSENFRVRNGHHNTFEHIACHDGMGIGFYLTHNSHHNLFLNCDGYNNYDPVSENGMGGQNDGFGCHVQAGNTDNIFIGCRAWNNSDDGYDLINCYSPVTFCYSIAYHNGYDANGTARQDGNGFKAGGYGMSASAITLPSDGAPRHQVYHCLAVQNKTNGIYSNHHLGGVHFYYNTSSGNGSYNYSLVNRQSADATGNTDVNGYNHEIDHNLSVHSGGRHVTALDGGDGQNTIEGNSFRWVNNAWSNDAIETSTAFVSTTGSHLTDARAADGMLSSSTLNIFKQRTALGYGCDFSGYEDAVLKARQTAGAEIERYTQTTVKMFLTAGQSNTAGRCDNDNLPDYIKALGSAYKYCNWSYTNGSTRKSSAEGLFRKFWPEMESSSKSGRFAYDAIVYYWLEKALQQDFYVVKHAAGGTSIDPSCTSTSDYHWSADATWLAEHASCNADGTSMLKALCDNIGKSIDALVAEGKTVDIKAMIWHQGESDRSGTGPDGYHDNLKAVVKYVRNYLVSKTGDSKYATLDFICGTVPTNSKQYNKKVYDALFTLASEDEHFHVIETSPGTFIGDQLHFDTNCAERLGIGMYNKMVDLGLVDGEKQTVPAVIYPEGQPVTLDFKTWATENVGDKSIQKTLTLSNVSIKTIDGTTDLYKAVGCEADGDFSEFAETFAVSANEVKMRGSVGLQLNSNKVVTFSILNLEPGDGVTITFGAGSTDVTTLAALSENIFVSTDNTQTVLTKGTALTSRTVTYVVKSGTQIDLTFGSTGGHYINSIVITPNLVEVKQEETAGTPIVHMCGDSMMSIYGDQSSDESANATYTQGMRGWGQFFQDCLTAESGIVVQDWAHTGTTAKGFYSGANYWPVVMGTNTMTDTYKAERPYVKDFVPVKQGDYVIMCWGHNDQKGGTLHNGYKTIAESEYLTYLTKMVNEVKAKGAYPILATSICRSLFSGKTLTRLGKIDACEAAGESHSDIDDAFDYPAAMRRLAAELGVPCIDLNAASQALWEDFGPGLTASVFFEGVGTTHTAEKGARAMGIAANQTIRSWDVTTDMYKDYATLQAAMKTDMVQYDKADYASSETTVATETVWTFEKSVDGQTTYASGNVITNALLDYNGLYLRGYNANNHDFKAQGVTGSFTFTNGKQVSWTMGAITSAMSATPCTDASTAGQTVTTATDRCIALNTSGPGTFYVAMRTKGDPTSGRYFKMAFNGTEVDSKASSKSVTELKYHADEAGVFYAWGTESYIVVAAYYVPDADSSEDDMHEPATTVSSAKNQQSRANGQYYDLQGRQVANGQKPTAKGLYLVNGKKVIIK